MRSMTSSFVGLATRAAFATVLLLLVQCGAAPTGETMPPVQCAEPRPRSTYECSEADQVRRFFFRSGRCKPFGICPNDAERYDRQVSNGAAQNYFTHHTSCQETCISTCECPEATMSNGQLQVACERGSDIRYSCNDGYVLRGTAVRVCQQNGTWHGEQPTCQEVISCPEPEALANGTSRWTDVLQGSDVAYSCSIGFQLVGSETRVCQSDSTWSGTEPICRAVVCPEPLLIANGSLAGGNDTNYKAEITYSCDVGFVLHGPAKRLCREDGSWSGEKPTCQAVQCPEPQPIANGSLNASSTSYGATITYSCDDDGFTLRGAPSRTCQGNSTWSGEEPTCIVLCPPPPHVDNTLELELAPTDGYNHGVTFTYTCTEGFHISPGMNPEVVCQNNGSWSQPPRCEEIKPVCPRPAVLANGEVSAVCWEPGCEATYECNQGYILSGSGVRTCNDHGQWDTVAPTCTKVEIVFNDKCVSNMAVPMMEGASANILCRIQPESFNADAPVWKISSGESFPFGVQSVSGTLMIRNVNPETANNYTCRIGGLEAYVKVDINDTGPIEDRGAPEKLFGPKSPISPIPMGGRVELICGFSGCPTPTVTWKRNGRVLPTDERIGIMTYELTAGPNAQATTVLSTLTIDPVSAEDHGEYKCIGQNMYGSTENPSGVTAHISVAGVSSSSTTTEDPEVRQRRSESSLCSYLDPDTVTLVGRVRRSAKRLHGMTSVRVEVAKVLRSSSDATRLYDNNKLIKTVLGPTHDSTRLKKDTTYLLTGRVANNRLHLDSDSISILPHLAALEDTIAMCQ